MTTTIGGIFLMSEWWMSFPLQCVFRTAGGIHQYGSKNYNNHQYSTADVLRYQYGAEFKI